LCGGDMGMPRHAFHEKNIYVNYSGNNDIKLDYAEFDFSEEEDN